MAAAIRTTTRGGFGRRLSGAAVGGLAFACASLSLRCGGGGRASATGDSGASAADSSLLDSSVRDSASDAAAPNDGPAVLRGAIQKGPFVLGSTVTLSAID